MKRFTLILSLLCFVCFGVNAQVLKVSDAPVNGEWSENTTWYLIQNMKGGVVSILNTTTDGKLSLANSTTPADDDANALWCIVGNEKTGYQFYNKASGTGKVLYASRALNAGAASFNMADKTGVVNEFFDIAKSQKNGYLVVKDHDNQNNYWNDRDKNLAYWNSTGATDDDGSSFAFLDVEGFNTTVDKIDNMLKDAGVEYSARNLATEETLYSNAPCTDTRYGDQFTSWKVLFDGNTSSFFHSEYAAGKTSIDKLDHYLRVDAGEQGTNSIIFTYTTRNVGSGECHPSHVVIEGSNSADGDYTMIKEYKSDELPNYAALKFTSEPLNWETPYRYIRFRVVSTYLNKKDNGNKAYFYLSEFGMTTVPNVSVGSEYEEYKDELTALYGVISEAKNAENIQNRTLAFNNVKYAYEAVERVLNKEYYALGDKIEELRVFVDDKGSAVGYFNTSDDFVTTFNNAVAVHENVASGKNDYVASFEALNALTAPAVNLPVDGMFYRIISHCTKDHRANQEVYVSKDGDMHFGKIADNMAAGTIGHIFQFVPAENGKFYIYNVQRGVYMQKVGGQGTPAKVTTDKNSAKPVAIKRLGVDNIIGIYPDGQEMMHAQDAQSKIVGWDETNVTDGSAWIITEVEDITALSQEVAIGDAGYATLCLGYNAAIPTGVEAYAVSSTNSTHAIMTQITDVIPANEAVILKLAEGAEAKIYQFNYVASANEVENMLQGSTVDTYIDGAAYVLGYDVNDTEKENVVFAPAKLTDGKWLNNANKAYLPAPANAEGIKSYSLRFEDGTTAIENVEVENEVKAIYDLTGRRVEAITAPGIYIVNGKKVLVK